VIGVGTAPGLTGAKLAKRNVPRLPVVSADLRRRILDAQPFFLDGALAAPGAALLLRQTSRLAAEGSVVSMESGGSGLADTLLGIRGTVNAATRAGMVPVGPRRMRIWWDEKAIPGAVDILADLSRPKMVMRFYDVTGLPHGARSWNHTFDIEVGLREGARTVDFWSADRVYVVALGVAYADGRFLPLARTNSAALPRDSRGMPDKAAVRSRLAGESPSFRRSPPAVAAESMAWFERGEDWPLRDIKAETLLYTLYRAFIEEGPRALGRMPALSPRDSAELEREYRERCRVRLSRRKTRIGSGRPLQAESFVIARLDGATEISSAPVRYYPAPVAQTPAVAASANCFAHYRGILAAACGGIEPRLAGRSVPGAIAPLEGKIATPFASRAASIRETAATLRRTPMTAREGPMGGATAKRFMPRARMPVARVSLGDAYDVDGAGSGRFAKSGGKFDRLTVLCEGWAEPGARLRVGGRLVVADGAGRFAVECVLSGRKPRLPAEDGTAGRVRRRGTLRVEWENNGNSAGKERKR
jgi:hypothetical protein